MGREEETAAETTVTVEKTPVIAALQACILHVSICTALTNVQALPSQFICASCSTSISVGQTWFQCLKIRLLHLIWPPNPGQLFQLEFN